MPTGTIARLLIDKGFGFIRDESGIEHFFHRSAVRGAVFELLDAWPDLETLGFGQMAVGVVVAFVTAYATIAWLLRFVATNSLRPFVYYRVALGALLVAALATGFISAT